MTGERVALIRSRLEAAFQPDELEIIDDSRRASASSCTALSAQVTGSSDPA